VALRRSQSAATGRAFGSAAPLSGRRSTFTLARPVLPTVVRLGLLKAQLVRNRLRLLGGRPFPVPRAVLRAAVGRAQRARASQARASRARG